MEARKWCTEYYCYQIVSAFVADSTEEVDTTINVIKDLMELEQSAQQNGGEDSTLLKESLNRRSQKDQSQILRVLAIFCCKLWKKDFGSGSDSVLETMNDCINFLYEVCLPNDDRKTHMIKAANTQRILELTRSNQKRAAKRLYSEIERKEGCLYPKDVKAAIYTPHEMPEHLMYDSFLLDMKQMIATVFETFRTPFLLELANVVSQHRGVDFKLNVCPLRIQRLQNTSKETEMAVSEGRHYTVSHTVHPGPAADESPKELTTVTADMRSKGQPSKIVPQKKATFLSFKTREIWRAYPAISFSTPTKLNEVAKTKHKTGDDDDDDIGMNREDIRKIGGKENMVGVERFHDNERSLVDQRSSKRKSKDMLSEDSSLSGDDMDRNREVNKKGRSNKKRVIQEHSDDSVNCYRLQRRCKSKVHIIEKISSNVDDLDGNKEDNRGKGSNQKNVTQEHSNDIEKRSARRRSMGEKSREVSPEESSSDISDFCDIKEKKRVTKCREKRARERCDDSGSEHDRNKENRKGITGERSRGEKHLSSYKRKSRERPQQVENDDVSKGSDRAIRSEGKRTKERYSSADEDERNQETRQGVNGERTRTEIDLNSYKRNWRERLREVDDGDIHKRGDRVMRSAGILQQSISSDIEVSQCLFDESDEDRTNEKIGKTKKAYTLSRQGCSSGQSHEKESSRVNGPSGKESRQEDEAAKWHRPSRTRRPKDSFSEGESVTWTPEKDSTADVRERQPNAITHQRRRFFTNAEETYLKQGVQRFGIGNWAVILQNYPFQNRTSVNLKDKYRNLVKSGKI